MWSNRHLIAIFYRPLFIANLVFNGISLLFIHIFGWQLALNTLFIKGAGYTILIGYQYTLYNHTYFYYRNAGVTVRKMYLQVFSLDFLLFMLMTAVYYFSSR